MATAMVQVCVPADALDADVFNAVLVNAPAGRLERVMVGNAELAVAAVDGDTHPQLVALDEREELLVSERLDVANDQEYARVAGSQGPVQALQFKLVRFLKEVRVADLVLPGRRIDVPIEHLKFKETQNDRRMSHAHHA